MNLPNLDKTVDENLDKLGGMYIIYNKRYTREHHNFTHYQEDLRHATDVAKQTILALIESETKKAEAIAIKLNDALDKHWNSGDVHRLPEATIKKLTVIQQELLATLSRKGEA